MTDDVPRLTLAVFRIGALFALLAVTLGAIVCATESGFECGNWPGCTDQALLPGGPISTLLFKNPWIEMTHRASAILAGPTAALAGLLALRIRDAHPLVKLLPWVTVAGAVVAGAFGRMTVLGIPFPAWGGALDLGAALVAMAAMVVGTVALERRPARWSANRVALLAWSGVGVLLVMHLLSLYAAGPGSYTRCLSWPVWELLSVDRAANRGLQIVRLDVAALALVLIVATLWSAWGIDTETAPRHWRQRPLSRAAIGVGACFALVLGFGLVIRFTGTDTLGVVYSLASVGLFFSLVLLASRASLRPRS